MFGELERILEVVVAHFKIVQSQALPRGWEKSQCNVLMYICSSALISITSFQLVASFASDVGSVRLWSFSVIRRTLHVHYMRHQLPK